MLAWEVFTTRDASDLPPRRYILLLPAICSRLRQVFHQIWGLRPGVWNKTPGVRGGQARELHTPDLQPYEVRTQYDGEWKRSSLKVARKSILELTPGWSGFG